MIPHPRRKPSAGSGHLLGIGAPPPRPGWALATDHLLRVSRDHQVFVGLDHPYRHRAAVAGDDWLVSVVAARIQLDAQEVEPRADALANRGPSLADAAGEDQRI